MVGLVVETKNSTAFRNSPNPEDNVSSNRAQYFHPLAEAGSVSTWRDVRFKEDTRGGPDAGVAPVAAPR